MEVLRLILRITAIAFAACYSYQLFYLLVALFRRSAPAGEGREHDYAVLICARNESSVIADLIESIQNQTYPQEKLHIFVLADNCTDDTALVARVSGATVYERSDRTLVGKGYALHTLLTSISRDYPDGFDGYFVFDADNLLAPDYLEQMDRTFSAGHEIVTSRRNSKNYGDSWVSAGYALWFLRESRYLNGARFTLGTSCSVSGTGFLFSRAVAQELCGWPFHTLTEDIEFSVFEITRGRKIAYCEKAEFFDEQPISFTQSVRQRMRWSKGYLQVVGRYGRDLLHGIVRGSFSCWDMTMNILPAFFLSTLSLVLDLALFTACLLQGDSLFTALLPLLRSFGGAYLALFVPGAVTLLTEWRSIHTGTLRKLLSAFTFPLFMMTYLPITFAALFCKVEWRPVSHTVSAECLRERREQDRIPVRN